MLTLPDADHREQVGGRGLQLGGVGDVGEQGRAGQEQRALLREQRGANGSTAPDDWPKLTIIPRGARQSSERRNVSLPTES